MKRIVACVLSLLFIFELSFQSFAFGSKTACEQISSASSYSPGMSLLYGGLSADIGNGKTAYANPKDGNKLYIGTTGKANGIKLTDEPVYSLCSDNGTGYCIAGNNIIAFTEDAVFETVYSSDKKITNLSLADGKIYFMAGGNVYSLVPGSSASVVCAAEGYTSFIAKEGGRIYLIKENKQIIETQSVCQHSLEGTEESETEFECFLYDAASGTVSLSNLAEAIAPDSAYETQDSVSTLAESITVNDVTIPTSEVPVGSHFTDNGKGCYDHRTGVCGNASEDMCNCKAFYKGTPLKAVQCYGYARYLYLKMFGDIGHEYHKWTNINLGTISKGNITVESFKELLKKGIPGSHLRVTYLKPDGKTISNHSLIIMDWNEAGFSACECNLDARCGVFVMQRPYSEFVPTLISVDFYCAPLWETFLDRISDSIDMFEAFWHRIWNI